MFVDSSTFPLGFRMSRPQCGQEIHSPVVYRTFKTARDLSMRSLFPKAIQMKMPISEPSLAKFLLSMRPITARLIFAALGSCSKILHIAINSTGWKPLSCRRLAHDAILFLSRMLCEMQSAVQPPFQFGRALHTEQLEVIRHGERHRPAVTTGCTTLVNLAAKHLIIVGHQIIHIHLYMI